MIFNVIYDNQIASQIDFETESLILNKRLTRAIKTFLILFICCVFSVLIPVFHFILVPGLAIGSFVMAYLRYNESIIIYLKNAICPGCKSTLLDKKYFRPDKDFSFLATCQNCSSDIKYKTLG